MKRAQSSATLSTATTRDAKPTTLGPSKGITRRRAALGEIDPGENATKTGGQGLAGKSDAKGKASAAERRPLATRTDSTQTTTTARRSTRSANSTVIESRPEAQAVHKRKAGISSSTATTRRPGISRGTSAASLASGSNSATSTAQRPSRALQSTASLTDAGPSPKRFRKSTPEDDVFVGHHYDADHQEVEIGAPGPKRQRLKDDGWTDLDAEDEGDPTMVSEYVVEAFNYMREVEVSYYQPRAPADSSSRACPSPIIWTSRRSCSGRCAQYSTTGS